MPLLLQRPSAHKQMPDVKVVQKGQVRLFKQVVDVHVQCSLTVLEISLNAVDEQACRLKLRDGKLEKELKKIVVEISDCRLGKCSPISQALYKLLKMMLSRSRRTRSRSR